MGVLAEALLGRRQPDEPQQLERPLPGGALVQVRVRV